MGADKQKKDRKGKKDKKNKEAKSVASSATAAPSAVAETASTGSKGRSQGSSGVPYSSGKRNEPGTGGFDADMARLYQAGERDGKANAVNWSSMNVNKNKQDAEFKTAKADLKQALQTCNDLAMKGLKMTAGYGEELQDRISSEVDKLKIMMAQDNEFVEEVRYKHCKLQDCCDATRDFGPELLQKDLVRNREIRGKCSQLIRGDKQPEEDFGEGEKDELLRVRNSIRSMFGGQKNLSNAGPGNNMDVEGARAMFAMAPGDVVVASGKAV